MRVLIAAFLLVSLAALCRAGLDFQIKVEPKSEDCFYRDYDVGTKVEFEWQVLDGGLLDIDVRVRSSF